MPVDAQHFNQFLEISHDLASTLDVEVLFRKILRFAVNLSNAETAHIYLFDEAKGGFVFQLSTSSQQSCKVPRKRIPPNSIAGQVAFQRNPILLADVKQDQQPVILAGQSSDPIVRSLIAVPLVVKEKVQGVLEVINKKQGLFNDNDVDILTVLAAQAAVAVENTRLYQQTDLINELVHELRTPLASILTISYLLKRSDLTEAQRQQFADSIASEAARLNDLANAYLEYSRLEAGQLIFSAVKVDLKRLLSECCRSLEPKAAEAGIQISLSLPEQALVLEADDNKIRQVVINLLINAIKYNHPGGKVSLTAWGDNHTVSFSVQDDGVGIPEADLPHVFEKFYRARNIQEVSGTGLGLSICSRIIEIHGGTISVQSRLKTGSTFTVELPVCI